MKKSQIIIVILLIIAAGYFFFLRNSGGDTADDLTNDADTSRPVAAETNRAVPDLAEYQFPFGQLSMKYPSEWNLATNPDNSEELQIATVESLQDDHEFYFCVNIDEYSAASTQDLSVTDLEVIKAEQLTAEGIDKSLSLVTFKNLRENASENDYQWVLTDEAPKVGDKEINGSVTNSAGRRLQILGRFNCREDERPDFALEAFNASELQQDAKLILQSLRY